MNAALAPRTLAEMEAEIPFDLEDQPAPGTTPPAATALLSPEAAAAVLRDTALAELNAVNAGIAALVEAYGGKTYAVTTTAGMKEASAARKDIRDRRYQVPHIVKAKKAELKAIGEAIETEGDRIIAALLEIEEPIDAQIKAEEDRKAAEKARKEQEARERKAAIDAAVAAISVRVVEAAGKPAHAIAESIATVEAAEISIEAFGDEAGRAMQVKAHTLAKLREMHAAQVAHEEAQAALIAERAALARERAAQAEANRARREQEAEQARQREEAQKQEEARLQAQRAELERQQAAARAQQEALDRREREQREEQERQARVAEEQRAAAARAEKKRAEEIAQHIADLGLMAVRHSARRQTAQCLAEDISFLETLVISHERFGDRGADAAEARVAALKTLRDLQATYAEQDRIAAEQEAAAQRQREEEAARAAAVARVSAAASAMHDALRQWAAAEATGDAQELANARAERDRLLAELA